MKPAIRHILIVPVLLVLIILLPFPGHAQKKKKGTDDPVQGLRMREAEFYFTEGEKFFILEDYAKALLYFHRSLEINPENATIHYKIAEVLARGNKQDDLVKASISIENALRLEEKNKYFYLLAANIYNGLGRFGDAAAAYESMLREISGVEQYLYELAAVYQYAGKPQDAIRTYDRAEEVFGINEVSSIQKARLYLEAGEIKEALAEGAKLVKAFPDEERFVMAFAELLSQKDLRDEAIASLEKFVSANTEAGSAKMLLAGFYRDAGLEDKAKPLLTALFEDPSVDVNSKIIILGAYNAELHQDKTKHIADTAKASFVTSLFEKLVATNADNANVHIVGGDLYLSVSRNREALREYSRAVEMGEVSFEVWENLLYLETQLEQWDNSIRHAEEALEMYPNQGMIHYFLGYGQMRKRLHNESAFSFEQAKKLSSSNPRLVSQINAMLGDAYHATGNHAASDKAYDEALAYNPEYPAVLNNYSYHLAERRENLDKAEKMSSTLIKNNPDNPTFLDTHAWVLYVKQKYREAKKIIERAISTGNANAAHLEHYGDILYQLGDVDGAVKQWEKARGMNAKSEILNKKIANRKIYE